MGNKKSFKEKYNLAVAEKDSILCAGVDPAEPFMNRGEKGLEEGVNKVEWTKRYLEATADSTSAIKPNLQYWLNYGDMNNLAGLVRQAHMSKRVAILDAKIADIGSTSEAGSIFAVLKQFDAVTIAPYAGNIDEFSKYSAKHNIGMITMCLMSSPGYKREKNMWVPLHSENNDFKDDYKNNDLKEIDGIPHVQRYKYLALNANKYDLAGIVIGAPSKSNHLKEEEIKAASEYAGKNVLVLIPGIGAQGGEIEFLSKYFKKEQMIANVGRGMMFPNGSNSSPSEQEAKAKEYTKMLQRI